MLKKLCKKKLFKNTVYVHTKLLQKRHIQLAFQCHQSLTVAESRAPVQQQVRRQTTLAEAGKQKPQPPVDNDAGAGDDDADEVSSAGTLIRTHPELLPLSHALPRTKYYSSAIHAAIRSGGRSSRPPSTSPPPPTPDPACPTPADRRCRPAADPPRSRPRRSRMQTRSKTAVDDQQVHTRRRLSRSTTTP